MDFAIIFGSLFALVCTASYCVLDVIGRKAKVYVDRLSSQVSQYPSLTVIKPVFGADANTERAFRSWLEQEYPEQIQFIFSLQDSKDPALAILEQLKSEFTFEVIVNPVRVGFSGKMSNLVHGLEKSEYETLADIFSFTWNQILTQVVGPSIIRHDPHGLAGGTILVKKEALERIGGLQQFRDILAEDFAMGRAAKEKELAIGLGPEVFSPTGTMRFTELYSKLQRSHLVGITMNPRGLPSVLLWYAINYGYLFLFLGNVTYQVAALLIFVVRAIYLGWLNTIAEGRFRIPWSFVIGDLVAVLSFVLSWFNRKVRWGDGVYRVAKGGKMVLVSRRSRE